jgi:uncharacterized repeat protein (TIGR03803 family)
LHENIRQQGRSAFASGSKGGLGSEKRLRAGQFHRKTRFWHCEMACQSGRWKDNNENSQKQFIYAMNNKSNGKSRIRTNFRNLLLLSALIASFGIMPACRLAAQTFTNLYSLNGATDGAGPGALILSDDTFYGTAVSGGSSGAGTVFKISTNGLNYTTLYTFTNGVDGNSPGSLILSEGTLYGTAIRGISRWGTLFKISTNGAGFTNFYNFLNGSDGSRPSTLIMVSNVLYGTASQGGSAYFGTFFSVNTDGSAFTPLHAFSGYNNGDGSDPSGRLVLSSNVLYGTTTIGGTRNAGTVYSINTDGSGYTNLHSLNAGSDGEGPLGGLLLSGDTLYGTAAGGGSGGDGTLFALNTDGAGFTNLYSFQGQFLTNATYVYTGASPVGPLVLLGSTLYGTAETAGAGSSGTIFSILTNGTRFLVVHSFEALAGANSTNSDGAYPASGLLSVNNSFYGTASAGGAYGSGAVFNFSSTPVPVVVTTTSLPPVTVHESINLTLSASGGQQPYKWTLISGALPSNGSLLIANGDLFGFPPTIGTYDFTVEVTDALGATATQALSLVVTNPDTLTVSITNVTAGMVVSNEFPIFTLAGTVVEAGPVAANVSISTVYYSINNSAWLGAQILGASNWVGPHLFPAPGANTVAAYAVDSVGTVSATNTVTLDYEPPSARAANVPGTPLTTNWNPGSNFVLISEGAGIGVRPLFLRIYPNTNAYSFTAAPGDVVFLLTPDGGNDPTNWAAVVNFFNPSDPTGSAGLAATEVQTFFPSNPPPGYFAGIPLFSNVVYVPITAVIPNFGIIAYYDEAGPAGGILSGQLGEIELPAAMQPGGIATSGPQLTIVRSGPNVILQWPTNATGFTLQSTTNLSAPVWTTVVGQYTVTNVISGAAQFYRLAQ